jgi:CRISPR/Cas system type I-B associated protein Csh2 (Cas7 group RAMP superfamily)
LGGKVDTHSFRQRDPIEPCGLRPESSKDLESSEVRVLRAVLTRLQDEARDVFASSGETVERFLRERRDEVAREAALPT